MTHPKSCERAQQHQCRCSACGGVQHGWPYALDLAGESAAERQAERDRIDAKWAATRPPRGRRAASKPRQAAATDSATVDLIDWLSENPRAIEHIQEVGNILTGSVVGELDRKFGGSEPREARRTLTDHFWCDLLVAIADGIRKFSDALDRVPEYATDAILMSRKTERRTPLLDALVSLAVRTAWEPIKKVVETTGIEELQRTCWILAVLICPAPEDHAAVRDGALFPLAKEGLLETSRERLEQVFPADWVRRLREDLGGA